MAETAKVLRIRIAGLGLAGSTMAQAISTHPNAKVAAAADPKRDVLENFARDFTETAGGRRPPVGGEHV